MVTRSQSPLRPDRVFLHCAGCTKNSGIITEANGVPSALWNVMAEVAGWRSLVPDGWLCPECFAARLGPRVEVPRG